MSVLCFNTNIMKSIFRKIYCKSKDEASRDKIRVEIVFKADLILGFWRGQDGRRYLLLYNPESQG